MIFIQNIGKFQKESEGVDLQKKQYFSPELELVRLSLQEVICNSFEDYSSQIIDDNGWGDGDE